MSIQLIGAGLPRTGTMALKQAAESLTGGRCYHMVEVSDGEDHLAKWIRVLDGETNLLDDILVGFDYAVDWPFSSLWKEAADRYPDAVVLLSHRGDAKTWWTSADKTVWHHMRNLGPDDPEDWRRLNERLQRRFGDPWDGAESAMAIYDAHVAEVRATISPSRLIEYQPGDGWGPLCRALNVAEPDRPFPHVNTTEEFVERRRRRKR